MARQVECMHTLYFTFRIADIGSPQGLEDITDAIMIDHRVFHLENPQWSQQYMMQGVHSL